MNIERVVKVTQEVKPDDWLIGHPMKKQVNWLKIKGINMFTFNEKMNKTEVNYMGATIYIDESPEWLEKEINNHSS